jgi:hypothetical protein
MRTTLIALVLIALLAAGCTLTGNAILNKTNATRDNVVPTFNETVPIVAEENTTTEITPEGRFTLTKTEGELVELKPQVLDPDGDVLTFTFSPPVNQDGRWQTKIGDEGLYSITIGVSDGASTSSEVVDIIVLRANRPPIISCRDIIVDEGEEINLNDRCSVTDEDNGDIQLAYSGWMNSGRYQTTFDDAGEHVVLITASDRNGSTVLHTVSKDVTIQVNNMDRSPIFSDKFPTEITATENDVIALPRDMVSDPDRDAITLSFSPPFDSEGVWKTKVGDAGSYDISVVASDGQMTAKRTVRVNVKLLNTAPVLKPIPPITVKEGETIHLPISATDREGDALSVEVSGWMSSDTYRTTFEDAGEYTTKVTVSDGVFTTQQVVQITVVDVNRPPVFISPA